MVVAVGGGGKVQEVEGRVRRQGVGGGGVGVGSFLFPQTD